MMLSRVAARHAGAARLLLRNSSPSLRSFHSSRTVRCGLVTVLQQSDSFSPLSAALRSRWQRDAGSVRLAVQRGLESIRHRGPDGQCVWMSEDGAVALGHVRLALIDLTPTGSQPLHDWKRNTHVAVNGELYNHRELRAEAEAAGWEFSSTCDSEIALYLYHKHGPLFPQELRGEFAFTLWDEERKLLVAGRDRFGIKPLFWTRWQQQLILASEIKALLAYGVPAVWDDETLATGGHLYSHRTVFKGIQQVPPGHFLVATPAGGVSFQRYWEMEYLPYEEELQQIAEYSNDAEKEEAAVRQVRARLVDAVQQRMIADVRVGVYLSGGLDSCSILGIAASLQSTPVDAFTVSFADQCFDESQQAQEMAQRVNANLHVVEATPTALADSFEASVYHCEYPVFNLNGTAKFLLSRAVRQQGMKAVLTGEGSDEIFAGYSFFRHDYVRYHLQDVARAKGIALRDEDSARLLQKLKDSNLIWEQADSSRWMKDEAEAMRRESERLLRFTPAMLSSIPFIHSASFFSPALRDRYAQLHPLLYHLSSCPSFSPQLLQRVRQRQLGQLSGSLYLESKTMLLNVLLCWLGDREEMAHSVEGRTPFLDHPLVELVNRLPLDLKLRLSTGPPDSPLCLSEKFVLKRAAAPYLPESVLRREKHPFLAPPSLLSTRSLMYHYIRETVQGREMEELRGVVDVDRLRAVLAAVDREIAEGRQAVLDVQEMLRLEQWLLGMCSLSVLRKQFKVQKE